MYLITALIKSLIWKEHFIEKSESDLLRVTVANELQYEKLLELHEELDKKFHHLTYKYVLIGDIFESFSEKFLIYCEVLSKLKFIEKLIEEKMAFNKKFREDILRLEKDFNNKKT